MYFFALIYNTNFRKNIFSKFNHKKLYFPWETKNPS